MKQDAVLLNEKIKELEEVKQYLLYKKLIIEDQNIQQLLKEIKQLQKQMQQELKEGCVKKYNEIKETLKQKKEIFNSNLVIQNYLFYKEEVKNIVDELVNILRFE